MRLRTLALASLLALACRAAQPAPAPEPAVAAPVFEGWPRSVAEAVDLKLRTMSESDKGAIRSMPRDRVQDLYHGFQMMHRAEFGLGEGNDALLASCGSVRMTTEDCMRIILDALWVALQGGTASLPR